MPDACICGSKYNLGETELSLFLIGPPFATTKVQLSQRPELKFTHNTQERTEDAIDPLLIPFHILQMF